MEAPPGDNVGAAAGGGAAGGWYARCACRALAGPLPAFLVRPVNGALEGQMNHIFAGDLAAQHRQLDRVNALRDCLI